MYTVKKGLHMEADRERGLHKIRRAMEDGAMDFRIDGPKTCSLCPM